MKTDSFFSGRAFYTLHVFIVLLFFISTKQSSAQIEKGTFTIGNSFFVLLNDKDKSVNTYVQLNTGLSYFVVKNLAIGLNYNWSKVESRVYSIEYHNFDANGAGLYARYYVFPNKASTGNRVVVALFLQAGVNISFSDHEFQRESEEPDQFKQTAKQFNLHPGLVVMVGKKWSFECSFQGFTYETYKTNIAYYSDDTWDYTGLGMNSVLNNQKYAVDIREPLFAFMGGIRYHF